MDVLWAWSYARASQWTISRWTGQKQSCFPQLWLTYTEQLHGIRRSLDYLPGVVVVIEKQTTRIQLKSTLLFHHQSDLLRRFMSSHKIPRDTSCAKTSVIIHVEFSYGVHVFTVIPPLLPHPQSLTTWGWLWAQKKNPTKYSYLDATWCKINRQQPNTLSLPWL